MAPALRKAIHPLSLYQRRRPLSFEQPKAFCSVTSDSLIGFIDFRVRARGKRFSGID